MSETVTCPSCNLPLRVREELLGQQVKCPSCAATFTATMNGSPRAPAWEEPPPERPRGRPSEHVAPRYEDEPPPSPQRAPVRRDEYDDDYDDRSRGRVARSDLKPHRGGTI